MRGIGGSRFGRFGSVAVLGIAAALFAGGCGDDDETTATTVTALEDGTTPEVTEAGESEVEALDVDPCTLLTEADVKDVLGKAVEGKNVASSGSEAAGAECEYEAGEPDFTSGDPTPTSVLVRAGDEVLYASWRGNVGGDGVLEADEYFEEVDGIGDEAFAGDVLGGALVGGTAVIVQFSAPPTSETHELVIETLEKAVANLPE